MGEQEYRELLGFIRRARRRIRFIRLLESTSLLGVGCLLLLLLGQVVWTYRHLPYLALVYVALALLVGIWLAGTLLVRICRPISQEELALSFEKRFPELRNDLINALQLYPILKREGPFSKELILGHLKQTLRKTHAIPLPSPARHPTLYSRLRLGGLLGLTLLGAGLLNPGSIGGSIHLILHPMDAVPQGKTRIALFPGNATVPRGWSLTVRATVEGVIPRRLDLRLWRQGKEAELRTMENEGDGRFSLTLPSLSERVDYQAFAGKSSSPVHFVQVVDLPEIGNVRFTLHPPDYTRLPSRVLEGNGEAILGSTVRAELATTKKVAEASMDFDDGRSFPLRIEAENRLQGTLVLDRSIGLRFHVKDSFGFKNQNPVRYELRGVPDAPPAVQLLAPAEDLTVSGDETLKLRYEAKDDFGLETVTLVIRGQDGKEQRLALEEKVGGKTTNPQNYDWEIWKLNLAPGGSLSYHVEARDNDTISGPKVGMSQVRQIVVKSNREEQKQLAELLKDVSESLLGLLGNYLESEYQAADSKASPESKSARGEEANLKKQAEELGQKMEQALKLMEKDRLSDFATWSDLEALKRNLNYTKDTFLNPLKEDGSSKKQFDQTASELERMAQLSEEIGNRIKAKQIEQTAEDLLRSQQRLLDSLEAMKNSGSKELDSVLKELTKMAEMLRSLSTSLSELATRFPDEFFNSQTLQSLGLSDLFRGLEEIRQKLLKGDIEGALQAARELMGAMSSMLAALQNAGRMAMGSSMDRMQGEMLRSQNELGEIAREQEDILLQTESMEKETLSRRDSLLSNEFDAFKAEAFKGLQEMARLFPDTEGEERGRRSDRDAIDEATVNNLAREMMARLSQRDLKAFQDLSRTTRQELGKKPKFGEEKKRDRSLALLDELGDRLGRFDIQPRQTLSQEDLEALQGLSEREGSLKQRTEEFNQKLKALFELFPSLDPKITRNVDDAASSMGAAQGKLAEKSSGDAIPPERGALQSLSESQQAMSQAMQQLAQRGQLGGVPMPYLLRMGRFMPGGRMIPMPGMPQFPQFNLEGGMTGFDTEKFKLPGKEAHRPPVFREEVQESLKENYPKQFKEQVESYFRNLTE